MNRASLFAFLLLSLKTCCQVVTRLVQIDSHTLTTIINQAKIYYIPKQFCKHISTFERFFSDLLRSPSSTSQCHLNRKNKELLIFPLPKGKNISDFIYFLIQSSIVEISGELSYSSDLSLWFTNNSLSTAKFISHEKRYENRRNISKSIKELVDYTFDNFVNYNSKLRDRKTLSITSDSTNTPPELFYKELFVARLLNSDHSGAHVYIPNSSSNVTRFVAEKAALVVNERGIKAIHQFIRFVFNSLSSSSDPSAFQVSLEHLVQEMLKYNFSEEKPGILAGGFKYNPITIRALETAELVLEDISESWLNFIYQSLDLPLKKGLSTDLDSLSDFFEFSLNNSKAQSYDPLVFHPFRDPNALFNSILWSFWIKISFEKSIYKYEASLIATDGDIKQVSISKDKLNKIIEREMSQTRLTLFLKLGTIDLPNEKGPFKVGKDEGFICPLYPISISFPVLLGDTSSDKELISRYVHFVRGKLDTNYSQSDLKKEFFFLFWKRETLEEYKLNLSTIMKSKNEDMVTEQLNFKPPFVSGLEFVDEVVQLGNSTGGKSKVTKLSTLLVFLSLAILTLFVFFFLFWFEYNRRKGEKTV